MVVEDVPGAFALVAEGVDVVLIIPEGRDIGPLPSGRGRLAVMIAGPDEAATRAAAEAMDSELFSGGHV